MSRGQSAGVTSNIQTLHSKVENKFANTRTTTRTSINFEDTRKTFGGAEFKLGI